MADVLRRAINQKKQFLKTKLLLSEFYQGRGEHHCFTFPPTAPIPE